MKAKRNLIQICLLCVAMLPAAVQAQFTFTTNNGAITITGYTGTNTVVTIPSATNGYPVTSIGNSAFFENSYVTSVIIPNSITNIGIAFPPGPGAFAHCTNLTSVTIGTNVASIGTGAFTYCTSLTSIIIPNSVTSIGGNTFSHCSSLTNITIPDSVTSIGSSGGYAFSYCNSLTSVSIPNSVINIGEYSFIYCTSLTNVMIGNSVTNIGSYVFAECTSLTAIAVNTNNPAYSSMAGVLFDKNEDTLIEYPAGLAGSYTVPSNVANIGDWAFVDCINLTDVTIGNSVTNIEYDAFSGCSSLTNVTIGSSVISVGNWAFDFCNSLTAITVDTNNPAYSSLAGVLFDKNEDTLIAYPGGYAGSYTVPTSVTGIGVGAFADCTSLTNIAIGNSVINIEDDAFLECSSLTSVYIQGNAPSAGSAVFYGDNNATVYYLPGTTGWSSTFDGLPAVLWNPQAQNDASFGVQDNQFGFNIAGSSNLVVVVEACTNLANPIWTPVSTNTLDTFIGTNGTSYFSDPQWANYPCRFYGFSWP